MFTIRRLRQHNAVEETPAEQDLSRILPPNIEDLSTVNTGAYGVCVIGEHTVAGVALARRRKHPQRMAEVLAKAHVHARQAHQHVAQAMADLVQAQRHAKQAQMMAEDQARRAVHAQGRRGRRRAGASTESVRRLLSGAISPQATVQELLEIRKALV